MDIRECQHNADGLRFNCREDTSGSQLVAFDVGGTVYTSSRQTFSAVADSWFTKVFSGEITVPRTAQDVRFVDRDAQVRVQF
jgi:hypothetical protein